MTLLIARHRIEDHHQTNLKVACQPPTVIRHPATSITTTTNMKRFYNLLLLVSLWSRLAKAAEVAEQTCTAEGICFANDDEAAEYYEKGKFIEIEWGEKQQVAAEHWKKTLEITTKTKDYMSMVARNETMRDIRKECKCRNQLCSFWAAIGR
jgi:hypothetical protein